MVLYGLLYRSAAGAAGEIMGQGEGLQWRPGRPNSNREQMHEALLKLRPGTLGFGVSGFHDFGNSGRSQVFFRGFGPADANLRLHSDDAGSLGRLAFPAP